jgi:hypothetical protein
VLVLYYPIIEHLGDSSLQRNVEEFSFRWNNRSAMGVWRTVERARRVVKNALGRRLTYRRPDSKKKA